MGWEGAAAGAAGVAAGGAAEPPARVLDCPVKAPPPVAPSKGLFSIFQSLTIGDERSESNTSTAMRALQKV